MRVREVILELLDKGYTVNKKGFVINPKGKELSGCVTTDGYMKIGVRVLDGISYTLRVHKFQAYLKFGEEMFKEGIVIRHLDGNPSNNSWKNIALGTQSENMMDRSKVDRIQNASNPKHDHKAILADREKGMTYKELMEKHGISSKGTLSFIINKSIAA
tara:strand:+ start:87 stop:563 length:477 start_codon:yes stop_codon:yes gene_type:complete